MEARCALVLALRAVGCFCGVRHWMVILVELCNLYWPREHGVLSLTRRYCVTFKRSPKSRRPLKTLVALDFSTMDRTMEDACFPDRNSCLVSQRCEWWRMMAALNDPTVVGMCVGW